MGGPSGGWMFTDGGCSLGGQVCGAMEEQGLGKVARSQDMSQWEDQISNI